VISLVVGGIGVMNIMLVSVIERTKEIGLRMAAGARQRDVMLQFLTEAVLICVIGAVVGVFLALGFGLIFGASAAFPMVFSWKAIAAACLSSLAIGGVFGFTPALRAAQLSPVEALYRE
jgi:macrolide transport system ATP-binding/permease protein